MFKVKKATGYICSDGETFPTKSLAEGHQEEVDLTEALIRCLDFYRANSGTAIKEIAAHIAEKLPTFIVGKIKVHFPEENDE
jgi:hypothetical protein